MDNSLAGEFYIIDKDLTRNAKLYTVKHLKPRFYLLKRGKGQILTVRNLAGGDESKSHWTVNMETPLLLCSLRLL